MVQNVYFGMYGSYFALNMLAVVHNIVFLIHINTALSLSHRIYSDSRIVSSHESNNNNKIIIIICTSIHHVLAYMHSHPFFVMDHLLYNEGDPLGPLLFSNTV